MRVYIVAFFHELNQLPVLKCERNTTRQHIAAQFYYDKSFES